ncbi:hypothetical protein Mapa_015760 [Marchantia paleacea]|nr:hypothetical protein Mapa_015760 [Marchantia paleacea]
MKVSTAANKLIHTFWRQSWIKILLRCAAFLAAYDTYKQLIILQNNRSIHD